MSITSIILVTCWIHYKGWYVEENVLIHKHQSNHQNSGYMSWPLQILAFWSIWPATNINIKFLLLTGNKLSQPMLGFWLQKFMKERENRLHHKLKSWGHASQKWQVKRTIHYLVIESYIIISVDAIMG